MKFHLGDIVELRWVDARGESGWMHLTALGTLVVEMSSTGYFLKQDQSGIWLSGDLQPNGESAAGVSFYPRGCVRSIKLVRRKNP